MTATSSSQTSDVVTDPARNGKPEVEQRGSGSVIESELPLPGVVRVRVGTGIGCAEGRVVSWRFRRARWEALVELDGGDQLAWVWAGDVSAA